MSCYYRNNRALRQVQKSHVFFLCVWSQENNSCSLEITTCFSCYLMITKVIFQSSHSSRILALRCCGQKRTVIYWYYGNSAVTTSGFWRFSSYTVHCKAFRFCRTVLVGCHITIRRHCVPRMFQEECWECSQSSHSQMIPKKFSKMSQILTIGKWWSLLYCLIG